MHTGYDNFWMHKNSRLKPVLNLPKNDNYSHALLTDSYKHMQSGGCPNHLSGFIPPQNNAASSHERDHYRNSHDQSMWPSSVYSLTFMPSYANNLHPQEPFFTHTNNFVYSSPNPQAKEKCDFRHLEMSNGNVNNLTMHNTNISTLANNGLAYAQNNKNTNTQVPRIRVKDVFSLNNKSVQSHLGLDGHFGIRQQKELLGCAAHCNRAEQTGYIKYKNANSVESSKASPHFEHRTVKQTCLNNQEQFQNSCSFYQQNDGFSTGNFEFSGGRQIESSLSLESLQSSTPASLLSQLLTQESILERGLQNCQGNAGGHDNAQRGHGGEKVTELHKSDYSDSDCSRSRGFNERAPENRTNLRNVTNVHCDLQENLPEINEVNLKSPNSTSDIAAKNAPPFTSTSAPLKEIKNQQNCFVKISIPYTGKSSFIRLNDGNDTERNSAVSLQSFFEQNDKNGAIERNVHNINDEINGVVNSIPPLPPAVGQNSFISHHASPEAASIRDSSANEGGTITHKNSVPAVSTSLTSSPRDRQEDTTNQRLPRQEFEAISNKDGDFFQNSAGAPEINQQKFAVKISRLDDTTVEQEIPTNDFTATPLALKQESFHSEIGSAQNPPGGKEFHRTIKAEENSENSTASECRVGLQPPEAVNKTIAQFHVEGCSSDNKSRSDSAPVTDPEDHIDKVKTLKSSSSKRRDVQKSERKKRGREVSLSRVNYKSNINRRKLDLLIQFLKKDQDSGGSSSCKEVSCRETASNANSDSYRSRRKLNKASVVRNKNNSREMISLMSPKITERGKNLEKTEDGKSSSKDRVMAEESVDVSKERMKCNNPCQEKESKKDASCAAGPRNEVLWLSEQQSHESSEKPNPKDKCAARDDSALISSMRAFQNSKTHFCVSCNVVSSIESFWINVVSGEVRCLNCFKRMTLKAKAKGNVLKSKSNDLNDSSVKSLRKRKGKTEKENKSKEYSTTVGGSNSRDEGGRKRSSKCESGLRKLNDMKENVRQELLEMFGSAKRKSSERKQTTNCSFSTRRQSSSGERVDAQKGKLSEEKVLKTDKSTRQGSSSEELIGRRLSEKGKNQGVKDVNAKRKRNSSPGEEGFGKRERYSLSIKQGKTSLPKEQCSEDGTKEETVVSSEKSHGRRGSRSEEGSENRWKKETKGEASSNTRRSSDDTKEEFRCHKVSVNEERGQKDLKVRHCTDESRKPLPGGEDCPARRDQAAEEAAKRSTRHETADKWKNRNIWREGHDHQRSKTSRLFGRRYPNAPGASARRSTVNQDGVENQKRVESTEKPRKRKNSDGDCSPRKVHIVQDFVKRDNVQATHPSKASKENDNSHRGNLWNARLSVEKGEAMRRRRNVSSSENI